MEDNKIKIFADLKELKILEKRYPSINILELVEEIVKEANKKPFKEEIQPRWIKQIGEMITLINSSPEKREIENPRVFFKPKEKISDLLKDIGIEVKNNKALCPFHNDKEASMSINDEKGLFNCFGCGEKGNIYTLKNKLKELGYSVGNKNKEIQDLFTIEGQTEKFNQIQPLFYDKSGMFWLWNISNTCWEISDEVDILNMVKDKTGKDIVSSKSRTEIINALKQKGRLNIPKSIKPTWIQFKNKIYDIESGENFLATPDYFVTNPIPYEVNGNPLTPTMDKIFEEWVGKEYVQTLYEILAYTLLPDYPINRLFCFIGAGMNGKSKFLELLRKFIGEPNICSTELDTLLTSRFEVTRLHKKLACLMGETNFNEMNKTSILKKLTGKDTIGFEYKNKNPFEDLNYAKIMIATNNLPTTTDKTIGFYRRWLIIDFPNQFSEKRDILMDIPEEEYNNLATNCVITLNSLLKNREFTNEGDIQERIKRYEDRSNPLDKFLKEYTEEDYNGFIWKFEFEKKLNEWCKENKFRELSEIVIGKKMKEKGIIQERRYSDWLIDGKNKQLRCWIGLKWKI